MIKNLKTLKAEVGNLNLRTHFYADSPINGANHLPVVTAHWDKILYDGASKFCIGVEVSD